MHREEQEEVGHCRSQPGWELQGICSTHPRNRMQENSMIEEIRQERFVDADAVAGALRETRRYVLYLARTGAIRSYPMGGRVRIKRKFLLSEVKSDLVGRKRKIRRKSHAPGALRDSIGAQVGSGI